MQKKFLALALALCMVAGVMWGCGKSGSATNPPAATPSPAPTAAPTNTPAPTATAAPTAAPTSTTAPTATPAPTPDYSKKIDVTWGFDWMPTDGLAPTDRYAYQQIEQKFNINIIAVPLDGDKKNLALNSDTMPDIFKGTGLPRTYPDLCVDLTDYWNNGQMQTVKDYIENNYKNEEYRIYQTNDSKIWGFPEVNTHTESMSGWVLNKTACDKAGISTDNLNTWDDIYAMMKAYKAYDPNSYPLASGAGADWFIPYGGSFEHNPFEYDVSTDQFSDYYLDPGYKDALQYMANIYKDGLINPEYATKTGTDMQADIINRVSIIYPTWWLGTTGPGENLQDATFTDQLIGLLPPKSQYGYRTMPAMTTNLTGNVFSFNHTVKDDPEKLARLIDVMNWMYTDEGIAITSWGEEGKSYVVNADGTKSYTQQYLDAAKSGDTTKFDFTYYEAHLPVVTDNSFGLMNQAKTDIINKINSLQFPELWISGMTPPMNAPADPDLNQEYTTLTTDMGNVFGTLSTQIIMGQKTMADFDAAVTANKDKLDRIVQLRNDEYNNYKQTDAYKLFKQFNPNIGVKAW